VLNVNHVTINVSLVEILVIGVNGHVQKTESIFHLVIVQLVSMMMVFKTPTVHLVISDVPDVPTLHIHVMLVILIYSDMLLHYVNVVQDYITTSKTSVSFVVTHVLNVLLNTNVPSVLTALSETKLPSQNVDVKMDIMKS
jgi:hypothetical protein